MDELYHVSCPCKSDLAQLVQYIRSEILPPGCTIFFRGPVGAGKTTTITELLHQYGIEGDIASPTYNYVFVHEQDGQEYAHFDCYRLEPGDFMKKGLVDLASDTDTMCLVEWSEHLSDEEKSFFSGDHFVWDIALEGENRVITLYKN